MEKQWDCVVCGSCTADILVRPMALDQPVGAGQLHHVEPIGLTTGGLASNAGIAMSRLGLRVSMLSYTGNDAWNTMMRENYRREGVDTSRLLRHPDLPSSSTVVMIDAAGQRSFAHHQGAPKMIDPKMILDNLDLIAASRMFLIGYYSLLPKLQNDLPEIFARIRETGCMTAMDAAGSGGDLQPLDRILPHLDVYVPSHSEATHQTGKVDPREIIEVYRGCGAIGLLGVKLGSEGALLQTPDGQFLGIPAVPPPGEIVDTTGAGDSFYAGLITGLLGNLTPQDAGRLAAATGAFCVTASGATTAIGNLETTMKLAGL
ncbi:putative sugar kinase YdjH [Rosistilla carotiformis]|uniref:Putative sugar kinase YdjH n=1 Tax=Rosistilla carotiformis TaxID=2528017 RepID=A0A518JVV8_9BACT|nr:carbohydrate kinase family protein [Rosistilla carotiformis]QDV69676.1 putative sugar kinase YdjH [Rosistilla carotiformis]